MNITNTIGNLDWDAVTAVQQLCLMRKAQLRALEDSVYAVKVKPPKLNRFLYLIYRGGTKELWGDLLDSELAIYPTFAVADYVRGQNAGSAVVKIKKTEFKTLPCFKHYLKEQMVNANGDFN
jgi:hypothetical protein